MSERADKKVEPEAKRLRSSEPDLLITVGTGDDCKEYHYHSQVMASHSSYIDTMLATPMKESQSFSLSFPDIVPQMWDLMMKYLDPAHIRGMDVEIAMQLAPIYDKYNFESGLKVCDQVLAEMYRLNLLKYQAPKPDVKPVDDLNLLIDLLLLANNAHLNDTIKHGIQFFQEVLTSPRCKRYGVMMFTVEQIRKLAPLIVEKRLFQGKDNNLHSKWTDEVILCPIFPEHFVLGLQHSSMNMRLSQSISGVIISGSSCDVDGLFMWDVSRSCFLCGRTLTFFPEGRQVTCAIYIGRLPLPETSKDWLVFVKSHPTLDGNGEPDHDTVDTIILWRNPYSANYPLPPKDGWEPVDVFAHGRDELKIGYLHASDE